MNQSESREWQPAMNHSETTQSRAGQSHSSATGTMTGQLGSPWHVAIPDPNGISLRLPGEGRANRDALGMAASSASDEPLAFADTGAGVNVLNFGKQPIAPADRALLSDLLSGGAQPQPATRVSELIERDWSRPGSGTVTRQMLDHIDRLTPAQQARLDQAMRRPAGDLYQEYSRLSASRKEPVREDLMTLLSTVRDQGLTGLRRALRRRAYLPAGLVGALGLESLSSTPSSSGQ